MLVTAVVTTFNRPELVRRAIQSVITQTYDSLEIIVVEDGSDNCIDPWLNDEGLDHIRYIRHKENRGLAAARNTALRVANGDYIAFLDDDDEWKPDRIEKQVQQLERLTPEERRRLGVIYCGAEVRLPDRSSALVHPRNQGNLREAIIREGAKTVSSACLFSREALEKAGGFDENLPSSIDHDIWMALAAFGYEARVIDEPLVITYHSRDRKTMMNTTVPRIRGIRLYVEKWTPTYQEWFGDAEGISYARRYFARVIGSLAVDKIFSGNLKEAGQATRAVFGYNDKIVYNLLILTKLMILVGIQRFLPRRMINLLRKIKGWLF